MELYISIQFIDPLNGCVKVDYPQILLVAAGCRHLDLIKPHGGQMSPFTERAYKRLVTTLIEELPEQQQMILSLYYIDELTFKEIAHVLNMKIPAVKETYNQALNTCLKPRQIGNSTSH